MKKNTKRRGDGRMAVFVPENGSFPKYFKAAARFAHFFSATLTLCASAKFVSERPRKIDFYRELLEEYAVQHDIQWDLRIYEDAPSVFLKRLVQAEDFAVVLRDDDLDLTTELLQQSSVPVLVIPQSYDQPFRRVLLASAGGRLSDRALGIAVRLGISGSCKVEVLTVSPASSPALRMVHDKAKYFFDKYNVKATYKIEQGHMKKTILRSCESKETSLLVLGANETDHWKDHRFRSFSEDVVDAAICPVLVVK